MNDILIKVEGLGKSYSVNAYEEQDRTLGGTIINLLRSPKKVLQKIFSKPLEKDLIWALKDVSFEIKQGEVVGVLGHNGAGKSTLLRILSKVSLPTKGYAQTKGRVGSLLHLGTGFNPELTGRENIYLSGAIYGMSRKDIDNKFKEIIDFSGIAEFIDTPVKRYSSGMNARLGFSVAIFSDPDILLVDEVLSVGDAEFRKKSLSKILEMVAMGVSILFVSHDVTMLKKICSRAILLESGRKIKEGSLNEILKDYLPGKENMLNPRIKKDLSKINRQLNSNGMFSSISYQSDLKDYKFQAYPNGRLEFLIDIFAQEKIELGGLSVIIFDNYGNRLINAGLMREININHGINKLIISIESLHVKSGTYSAGLWMVGKSGELIDQLDNVFSFNVVSKSGFGLEYFSPYSDIITADINIRRL